MAKVLLVDDEITMVQMVTEMLRADGHEVSPFTSFAPAMDALPEVEPELVITDLYLDKTRAHGLDIIQKARSLNPPPSVIMITGMGSIETAVEAMKRGAYDYIEKPFKLDELRMCVQRALSYNQAVSENVYLRKQLRKKYQFNQIIGSAPKMQTVFKMIERLVETESTVLIRGESGTGKELVAKALHFNSKRQFAPFIPVNCSALPEHLLESELFGHRKGAFTGAFTDKMGLFHEADHGTIFLDEIGSMSPVLQSRLLRVLQEKEVRRVGDNTPVSVDVRVLAATNEPLEQRVKEGRFREDLYYRLNVVSIPLPPLRERIEDLPLLVSHFLRDRINPRTGHPYKITRHVMAVFGEHTWPGNVRELENAIERACALAATDTLGVDDLPPVVLEHAAKAALKCEKPEEPYPLAVSTPATLPHVTPSVAGQPATTTSQPIGPLKDVLRQQERAYIHRVLGHCANDKEKAAEILQVSLATLYRKLSEDDGA